MRIKKIFAVFMAVIMSIPYSVTAAQVKGPEKKEYTVRASGREDTGISSASETTDDYRYFYYQLTPQAKKMYDAMYRMYKDGTFQKGQDYDLVEKGYVTQEQLSAGSYDLLLNDMGAARDAFQYDYPDVFYVDFSALSLRVTEDSSGIHAYLGAGRRENYFLPGFAPDNIGKAVSAYETAIQKVVDLARAAKPDAGVEDEDPAKTMTEAVHKYIVENMVYKFENEVKDANCNARTAYDCLIYGEGVCEAYTRGFKAVLDRLEIPCVCVYGIYRASEKANEEHIWNYVQVAGEWYGVDVTHDDPRVKKNGVYRDDKKSGQETEQYLLVGQAELASHHIPTGIMSTANYEFAYPALAMDALRGKTYYNDGDFIVKVMEDSHTEGGETIASGTVLVSYKGMNYTENAERGEYILSRFATCEKDQDGHENWKYTKWGYIVPELYNVDLEPKEGSEGYDTSMGGHYLKFIMPHLEMIQFAVTTVEPDLSEEAILDGSLYYDYYGLDPALFPAMTESYQNIYYSGYVAPPYPQTVTPALNTSLDIGGRNHVKVTYNQDLAFTEEKFEAVVEVEAAGSDRDNVSAGDYYKIENLSFDGQRTIEFDFTPSRQFADNGVFYNISFRGIAGKETGRALFNLTYLATFRCSSCAYRAQGFQWNIYGQPQLIDHSDIATGDWIGRDIDGGSEGEVTIDSKISHRLTLVTTETSPAQRREMEKTLLGDESIGLDEDEILSSNTYNIMLMLCKAQIIQTGQGVRVSVGFPAGFNYDSSLNGVTFKAYHYITDDKTGKITSVEEIPLTVTPYGLVVTVKSFSPFTIAAVDLGKEAPADPAKTVILSGGEGGKISAPASGTGMLTLNKGGSATVRVKADDGYVVDTVSVGGVYQSVERNSKSMDIVLDYNNIADGDILDAQFVAESVAEREQKANATVVQPAAEPTDIYFEKKDFSVMEGSELTITPDVAEGNHIYQWYRGSEPLSGQTGRSLVIKKAEQSDTGEYTLKVTTYAGMTSASSEAVCTVTVREKDHEHSAGEAVLENSVPASCVKSGSHDEVIYCTICNDVMLRESVTDPATGHHFGEWVIVVSPSETETGNQKHVCSTCGYSEVQLLARKVMTASPSPTENSTPQGTVPPVSPTETPKQIQTKALQKGDIVTIGNKKYTVTKTASKTKTGKVKFDGLKKSKKKVTIPATVKLNGVVYKVTTIAAQAFKNDKKIKTVSIGKNVDTIGKKAFYKCKGIKNITFKTTKITKNSVGIKAFYGINKKVKCKVPKKKLKAYQKILWKAGVSTTAKWAK